MNTRNGVLSVIGASFLYGIMPIFTKRVLLEGLSSNALVFNRFFFTAVFALAICLLMKIDLRVSRRQLIELIFRYAELLWRDKYVLVVRITENGIDK